MCNLTSVVSAIPAKTVPGSRGTDGVITVQSEPAHWRFVEQPLSFGDLFEQIGMDELSLVRCLSTGSHELDQFPEIFCWSRYTTGRPDVPYPCVNKKSWLKKSHKICPPQYPLKIVVLFEFQQKLFCMAAWVTDVIQGFDNWIRLTHLTYEVFLS